MQKMTLDELRQYVETMSEGTMVIVELGEVIDDRCNESTDGTSE